MQIPATNKRRVSIYIDRATEDRIMIHGKKGHHKLASQVTILVEEALEARAILETGSGSAS